MIEGQHARAAIVPDPCPAHLREGCPSLLEGAEGDVGESLVPSRGPGVLFLSASGELPPTRWSVAGKLTGL